LKNAKAMRANASRLCQISMRFGIQYGLHKQENHMQTMLIQLFKGQ